MSTSLLLALAVSAGVAAGVFLAFGVAARAVARRDLRASRLLARGAWTSDHREVVRRGRTGRGVRAARRRRAASRAVSAAAATARSALRRLRDRNARSRAARHAVRDRRAADGRRGDHRTPARIFASRSSGSGSSPVRNRRRAASRSRWPASWRPRRPVEWRAGRLVRMPAVLRRPARYLNEGVADQELLLARRGIALVGSAKSAALVQVVERGRWFDEWASAIRASVRERAGASREHARSAVGRGGGGDSDWRSRLARSGCRAAPAGSGDLPRHRHLRRQHRHSGGVDSCRAVGARHSRRLGGGRAPWRCWRRMPTSPAQGRPCCAPP